MIEKIQHATASSPEGAKGLVKGILACAFQNMAFMLPTGLLYLLVKDLLAGSTSGRTAFYLLGCLGCFALIFLTTWFQYNGTYFTTYKESGTRRLTLAERLRKLPLSFFGKRDLADLTSTIIADCEVLEKDCSHFIPGLFGSLISTVLIALSLFTFDGRMALAALWVITVSVAIVVGSYRVQGKVQARTMAAKMACADGIQEYIETLRDLKASNAEQRYLSGLSGKIRAVEKQSIAAELETALSIITTAYLRSEDILTSVEENLEYLNPPVKNIFQDFVSRIRLINPDLEAALDELRARIADDVFKEWVDALKACLYDRSLKTTLTPIVAKLSDMRIVNAELEYMVMEPRKEFITMVVLVVGNIPLLYFLNKDWYHTLMHTVVGQIMLSIAGIIIFVSTAHVIRLTKPIEYRS